MDITALALAKKYTNTSIDGLGVIKGKNCTVKGYREEEKEVIVTFQWTADDGTVQTTDVPISYEKIAELANFEGGGSEAFVFTFDCEPSESERPISNLSATYDEIKAAIDGGMTVYGVGNAYGYMYMQFTPAVWEDEILVFSAVNPDGGLPYLLTIDSISGNGVVRTEELEEAVFSFGVDTHIEDGTRFIDLHGSYDDINDAFVGMKSVVCNLNVLEQDGTRYDVSLYTQSRVDGTIVFSGKAAPHGVENEYTLTIKYTGEKTLDIKEADEKLKEAVKTANNYTDEQIEKLSTAEALSVDEKPLYEDGKITYVKDGVTHTLEDGDTWFYYRDADGALFQTIWIDGTEHTIKAGNVDLTEYLKKTSVVMPKENISDPDPEYKAEDVPSMALLEKLLAENGGSGGGNPVGTVIAFSGLIPPKGYLLCDGAEVSRTEYKDLFSIIGELYGAGDGSTTFNVPNLTDRFVQGIGANTLGTTMEAGLPNINAKFDAVNLKGSSNSGAVYTSRRDDGAAKEGSGAGFGEDTYYFNASRSSAIYGKSNTVQPPAVVMTYIIRAVAGEAVDNDYVAGEGIEINPTVVDGKEVLEISSVKQELTITGQLRGSSEIVSLDKTFAEIKAAIEAEKSVTLYIFEEGSTENPYVFTPSVILADTINFSLVYGVNAVGMFILMSVDINSDDTYTVNSQQTSGEQQGLTITGKISGLNQIASIDKTFVEIKEAIESAQDVTLLLYTFGKTTDPYVFKPSTVNDSVINFSLVYGDSTLNYFMLMSIDIKSNDTYTLYSQNVGKYTPNFERRQTMPTGADDDPIRPDFLYVDESKGETDKEAAMIKRYAPDLSSATDGYLRYLPVDSFVKTFDALTLLNGLTASSPAPQGFVIADSLLYLQGYLKTSKTFSSAGWHIISEFDLATIGYEWAGLEEGLPIRALVSVWLDNAYVNSCISIYNVTGSPSTGNFTFYVTNALVNKAIAFNLNVLLPVRKKR